MEVSNSTKHEIQYRVKSEISPPFGPEDRRSLSAGDRHSVLVSWIVEFFVNGKIVARQIVHEPEAVVKLSKDRRGYRVEVTSPTEDSHLEQTRRLIEAMLPPLADLIPNEVKVLQARSVRPGQPSSESF